MKIKAIVFDMDGTIIDTTHAWDQATIELIKSKNPDLTNNLLEKIQHSVHGLGLESSCKIIKDIMCIDESVEQLIAQKTKLACGLYSKGIKFINGFEDFYSKVKNKQFKTGIATNADKSSLKLAKELLNLENFFGTHIYDISQVNNLCKPDPAIYLHAAEKMGLQPNQCIAIEDSAHGIKAAKAAGIFCIGINTSEKPEMLKEADYIIQNYQELDLDNLIKKYF